MTQLMGILNVTPDSFYDGGRYVDLDVAVKRAQQIQQEGADILDIGGESTRPGSESISEQEELDRVVPVIQALKGLTIPISIDTSKASVAAAAVKAGAKMINDISGLQDPKMREIATLTGVDVCIMHMQGTPRTMQQNPEYSEGIIPAIVNWFEKQINILLKSGIREKQIILDPGIGFGKTVADNLEIIQNIPRFKALGFRILIGASRKSFMSKILKKGTVELLPATLAVSTLLIHSCVDIIRVHDVREHREIIDLLKHLSGAVELL